jgi:hypothetical protein
MPCTTVPPSSPHPLCVPHCLQLLSSLAEGWSYVSPAELQELGQAAALELNGLCPLSLAGWSASSTTTSSAAAAAAAGGEGSSVPQLHQSRPELGCIRAAEGLLYGCSSPASLLAFARDPAGALAAVQRQAKRHPLLVHLLGLQQAVPQCNLHTLLAPPDKPLQVDFSTQTPTHFVEANLVRDYEWNAWVLRRRALALAEMKRKRTHSTQTAGSHFRREVQTQVGWTDCSGVGMSWHACMVVSAMQGAVLMRACWLLC